MKTVRYVYCLFDPATGECKHCLESGTPYESFPIVSPSEPDLVQSRVRVEGEHSHAEEVREHVWRDPSEKRVKWRATAPKRMRDKVIRDAP